MHKPTPEDIPSQKPIKTAATAASLVDKALSRPSTESKPQSQIEKLPEQLLDRLWLKMAEMYGHRWTANFGVKADQDSAWATVLAGLNGQQLANGLNILVDKGEEFDWPPPAPVFRAMCLQVPGLPTEDEAWEQALRGVYKHKIVEVSAKLTGTFDLQTTRLDDKAMRKVFARNFAVVRARAVMGKPLEDEIPLGPEHEHKSPMQVQFAHSHQEARRLMEIQGIPNDPKQARAMLLAKMGIRRDSHA